MTRGLVAMSEWDPARPMRPFPLYIGSHHTQRNRVTFPGYLSLSSRFSLVQTASMRGTDDTYRNVT